MGDNILRKSKTHLVIGRGFTFIEIMVVVAIIAIIASAVLVSIGQSRKNARINGARTTLRSALLVISSCKDSGSNVMAPSSTETGNTLICQSGIAGAFWPRLPDGYVYGAGGANMYNSTSCNFKVSTSDTETPLVCDCITQTCK